MSNELRQKSAAWIREYAFVFVCMAAFYVVAYAGTWLWFYSLSAFNTIPNVLYLIGGIALPVFACKALAFYFLEQKSKWKIAVLPVVLSIASLYALIGTHFFGSQLIYAHQSDFLSSLDLNGRYFLQQFAYLLTLFALDAVLLAVAKFLNLRSLLIFAFLDLATVPWISNFMISVGGY